jgi:hypothetical protein
MLRLAVALWALLVAPAAADDLTVGPGEAYGSLKAAIAASASGDTITLIEGRYTATDLRIPHDLTLAGEGNVVLYSPVAVQKGLLVPLGGTSVTVRNLTFEGARSPDKNGAGIRFEGSRLVVDGAKFVDNENGILATGDAGGSLVVTRSMFLRNGHGDGYSHGIYQSNGARFDIRDSAFLGTRIGHHLKTLAGEVAVLGNRFDDEGGETSYVVDATAGGDVWIEGNEIVRRRSASQNTIFNYDISRGGTIGVVTIRGNSIVTEKPRTQLLRNPDDARTIIDENRLDVSLAGSYRRATATPPQVPGEPVPVINQDELAELTPQQRRAVRRMSLGRAEAEEAAAQPEPQQRIAAVPDVAYWRVPKFSPLPPNGVARLRLLPQADAEGYTSYGQAFRPGDLRPSQGLALQADGRSFPVQMDVKASYADGSVRHAVLSLGGLGLTSPAEGVLVPATPSAGKLADPDPLVVEIVGQLGEGATSTYRLVLDPAKASDVWLDGPFAREVTVCAMAGPLLGVTADMRRYGDGSERTRLTFENHKVYADARRDLGYRVTVSRGDETLLTETIGLHYRNAGWTVVLGARPAHHVVQDPELLMAAHAVPPLRRDLALPARATLVEPVRPGDHAPLVPYMPTGGGRPDIGVMTGWGAAWALTQAPAAQATMMRAAEIGITIPWHFEDDGTGLPVRTDERPGFWADARGSQESVSGADRFPVTLFDGRDGGWTVDIAHRPSLAYPAYLATGEAVFARELAHEAAFAISGIWPDLRGEGTLVIDTLQLREMAWSLRSVGNAAWLLPDDHPLKGYFETALDANLRALAARHLSRTVRREAAVPGFFRQDSGRDAKAIAPWQNDFATIVLAQEALRGSPVAAELVRWTTNYVAGRVLAAPSDPDFFAGFRHVVRDAGGTPLDGWAAIRTASADPDAEAPNPGTGDGGIGLLRASLAAIIASTGDDRAQRALEIVDTVPQIDRLTDPDNPHGYAGHPQFAIAASPGVPSR